MRERAVQLQIHRVPRGICSLLLLHLSSHRVTGSVTAMGCSGCGLRCHGGERIASEPSVDLLGYCLLKPGKLGLPHGFEAHSSDVQRNPVPLCSFIAASEPSFSLPLSQMLLETSFSKHCTISRATARFSCVVWASWLSRKCHTGLKCLADRVEKKTSMS